MDKVVIISENKTPQLLRLGSRYLFLGVCRLLSCLLEVRLFKQGEVRCFEQAEIGNIGSC